MTRKDYVAIAAAVRRAALKNNFCAQDYARHYTYVSEIAEAFAADNPRFDWARFVKACDPRE